MNGVYGAIQITNPKEIFSCLLEHLFVCFFFFFAPHKLWDIFFFHNSLTERLQDSILSCRLKVTSLTNALMGGSLFHSSG